MSRLALSRQPSLHLPGSRPPAGARPQFDTAFGRGLQAQWFLANPEGLPRDTVNGIRLGYYNASRASLVNTPRGPLFPMDGNGIGAMAVVTQNGSTLYDEPRLKPTAAITIGCWFLTTDFTLGTYHALIDSEDAGGGAGYLLMWTYNTPYGLLGRVSGYLSSSAPWLPASNTWHFAAVSFGSTVGSGYVRLYADGVFLSQAAGTGNPINYVSSQPVSIGFSPTYGQAHNGFIDSPFIYDRELSADEIMGLYLDTYAAYRPALARTMFWLDSPVSGPTATGTATGRAGARATDVGAKTATSATTGRAGARATITGGKIASSPVTGEVGARTTDTGTKTASSSPVGRAGARATDAGAKTAVSTVAASAGSRATDAGVKTANAGTVGTAGARTTAIGTKTAAAATHGSAGLEGYGSSSGPVAAGAVVGTLGARAQCSGTAIRSGSTTGRAGARATGAGVATRANVVVGSVGAREQCAGTRTTTGAARGSAGLRGFVSNALPPPPDPVPNNRECEADYSLAATVVWPVDDTPEDQSGRVYDFNLPTKPSWL